ncbi:MAG: hypothetical protein RSD63_06200 [Eubacterium sp.]
MGQVCFVLGIILTVLVLGFSIVFEGWLYTCRQKLKKIFNQKYRV